LALVDLVIGDDGRSRCSWCVSAPDYVAYHDQEWGRPVRGDEALFERITLEAFQSGLSWLTILRKRENFRAAFSGFDPAVVAAFDARAVERLMADAGIVRNRRKIEATVTNARALVGLVEREGSGALDRLVWSFAPEPKPDQPRPRAARLDELPGSTAASVALSKALKREGFTFVGPTTMYAAMQACGLVDDHLEGCHRAA
jgi:DNA-3-methyladenine glycosylase I